jgi:nicotinamide-nucleotide amidase
MAQLKDIAREVVDLLLRKKMTLSLAESCTGGMIAAALVDRPGVSAALVEGCVCYSNEAKMRTLGVREETLRQFGAVSAQCALEMVHGMCDYTGSDCAIAVTGIAGPGGGTKDKPVGLVYFGVLAGARERVERRVFQGDRTQVREQAAACALELMRDLIEEKQGE